MSNLQHWQTKIQDKRKTTDFRDFVMEICSWKSLMFYKHQSGLMSPIPPLDVKVSTSADYYEGISHLENPGIGGNFIDKLHELLAKNGLVNTVNIQSENSQYADIVVTSSNVYLSSTVINDCKNILYSLSIKDGSIDVYNSLMVGGSSQNIYSSRAIINGFNIFFSENIDHSSNIWHSSNLQGCVECINCHGLSNVSYCIDNEKLSEEEYLKKKSLYLSRGLTGKEFNKSQGVNIGSINCHGQFNVSCNDCFNAYYSFNINRGSNIILVGSSGGAEDVYDCITGGSPSSSHLYGVVGSGGSDHVYCSISCGNGSNLYYSIDMQGCSFCLGCIGLRNKSYCILNKQYTKEERYEKVDEIFGQMENDGTLGQFFPASMNPFYFNDTAAYLIDPSFTKEEVTARGYLWRDEPIKIDIPTGAEVVKTSELGQYEGRKNLSSGGLPERSTLGVGTTKEPMDSSLRSEGQEWYIDPAILKKIIQDEEGNVYRIVPMEYEFLMKHGLPLPRKHWLDRMKENFRIN